MTSSPSRPTGLVAVLSRILDRRIDRFALLFVGMSATLASFGEATVLVVISLAALRLADDTASPVGLPFGLPVDELGTPLLLIVGLGALALRLGSLLANSFVSARLMTSTLYRWRSRLFHSYQNSTWEMQSSQDDGYLQTIVQTYASRVGQTALYLSNSLTAGISFVIFVMAALAISPLSALALFAFGALLYLLLRPLSAHVRRLSMRQGEASKEYARLLTEAAALSLEHRVLGSIEAVATNLDFQLSKQSRSGRHQMTLQLSTPQIYTGIGYLAILAGLAFATSMEVGDVASLGAIILMMIRSLGYGQAFQGTTQAVASAQPFLAELLETVERFENAEQRFGILKGPPARQLKLNEVSLGYGGDVLVTGLSLTIEAGQSIGIIGPSGGGKSTLALTLLGLIPPVDGAYEIDGVAASEYSAQWWHTNMSFVPQRPELFDGSVAENILIHRQGISAEEVEAAARAAHLGGEIAGWPDGLGYQVGPRGSRLSGGQRQRICIARALVGHPRVLVLDEPTSALDSSAEDSITEVLQELRHSCTLIVVAHRISTLAFCDRVILVDRGRAAEIGSGRDIQDRSDLQRLCSDATSPTIVR